MGEHTPGPWAFTPYSRAGEFAVHQADGAPFTRHSSDVATVAGAPGDPPEIAQANARLIAAATDMYEALEEIKGRARAFEHTTPVHDAPFNHVVNDILSEYVEIADDALRKVRGDANE